VKLAAENRKKAIWAAALGGIAVLALAYEVLPFFLGGTSPAATVAPATSAPLHAAAAARSGAKHAKKVQGEPSLDPTLHLTALDSTEQIKYSGSGRNIFVSQAEPPPTPITTGATDHAKVEAPPVYTPPPTPQAPPIPLKFFGFANQPGEPKRVFLSQGEDVFIAGEGEIVDRRYKVVRISATSVEMQDVVNSGPPQSIPLTQG
jgi:hypothetical protein